MDHLQSESDRLAEEKPEEAAEIKEKVVLLTDVWQELKQMVSFHLHLNSLISC